MLPLVRPTVRVVVRFAVPVVVLACAGLVTACGSVGGKYVQSDGMTRDVDRGDTNGRRFDFVSNKPDENDDWQVRVTGSSMWISYARAAKTDKLGSFNLTDKESHKLWRLIDNVDIPNRKPGKKDEDNGYVSLQLKEPGDDDAGRYRIYVSRETTDEDVIALATYLQDLTQKYKKERPGF